MVICVYIFSITIFSKSQRRIILKRSVGFCVILLFMFITITSSRLEGYSSSSSSVDMTMNVYLLQYAAEGQVLFNAEIWDNLPNTNGDVNFCFYKKLLGMKTYTTYREREDYYIAKNGMRIEVFRTYVGDFISDLGYMGGLIFCLIITFFVYRFYNDGNMTIPSLMLFTNLLQLYGIGFASNVYRDYSMSKGFFIILMVACLFSFVRKNSNQFILIKNEDTSFNSNVLRSRKSNRR